MGPDDGVCLNETQLKARMTEGEWEIYDVSAEWYMRGKEWKLMMSESGIEPIGKKIPDMEESELKKWKKRVRRCWWLTLQ